MTLAALSLPAASAPAVTSVPSDLRIVIVADHDGRGERIRAMIEPHYAADVAVIDDVRRPLDADVVIVAASLRDQPTIAALRGLFAGPVRPASRIFTIDGNERSLLVQAYALGATDVVFTPFSGKTLRARLRRETHPVRSPKAAAAAHCAKALEAIFLDVASGDRPLDLQRARDTTQQIIGSVAAIGLSAWIDDVRRHHEGTFQHCLLIAGIAVDFGMSLNFTGPDLLTLGIAATLHDIGKAGIPREILEKQGPLDASERAVMERHPVLGYESVKYVDGLPTEVRDAVLHHHELLDGSGYPHGLRGAAIADLTRMITIADVFGSLIERRGHSPAMPRRAAYTVLCEMTGQLEQPLVVAFAQTALQR